MDSGRTYWSRTTCRRWMSWPTIRAPAVCASPSNSSKGGPSDSRLGNSTPTRIAASLMTLQGACPELSVLTKPQCQIVPLALEGTIAVSPGCAVSRVRMGLRPDELTCALPACDLAEIVGRLTRSRAADAAVSAYADDDLHANFTRA